MIGTQAVVRLFESRVSQVQVGFHWFHWLSHAGPSRRFQREPQSSQRHSQRASAGVITARTVTPAWIQTDDDMPVDVEEKNLDAGW